MIKMHRLTCNRVLLTLVNGVKTLANTTDVVRQRGTISKGEGIISNFNTKRRMLRLTRQELSDLLLLKRQLEDKDTEEEGGALSLKHRFEQCSAYARDIDRLFCFAL